jgi:hypothetical protein
MAGLVPAIHALLAEKIKTWMPGTSPGMTSKKFKRAAPVAALFLLRFSRIFESAFL